MDQRDFRPPGAEPLLRSAGRGPRGLRAPRNRQCLAAGAWRPQRSNCRSRRFARRAPDGRRTEGYHRTHDRAAVDLRAVADAGRRDGRDHRGHATPPRKLAVTASYNEAGRWMDGGNASIGADAGADAVLGGEFTTLHYVPSAVASGAAIGPRSCGAKTSRPWPNASAIQFRLWRGRCGLALGKPHCPAGPGDERRRRVPCHAGRGSSAATATNFRAADDGAIGDRAAPNPAAAAAAEAIQPQAAASAVPGHATRRRGASGRLGFPCGPRASADRVTDARVRLAVHAGGHRRGHPQCCAQAPVRRSAVQRDGRPRRLHRRLRQDEPIPSRMLGQLLDSTRPTGRSVARGGVAGNRLRRLPPSRGTMRTNLRSPRQGPASAMAEFDSAA